MDGNINGEVLLKGYFDTKNNSMLSQFYSWQKTAKFQVNDGVFKMNNPKLNIDNLSGEVSILNNKCIYIYYQEIIT